MCHVHACADDFMERGATETVLFLKSEDTGTDWAQHSRDKGDAPGGALLSHSGRCLPGDRKAEGSWGPLTGASPTPVTTQRSTVRCLHPCPQHEAGGAQERALGVSSSLRRRRPGSARSARSTCPPHPRVVSVRGTCALVQLRNVRVCGYQQFTAETQPAPSRPQGRGPAPGASCCKGEGLLGNKGTTDPRPGASILVGRYKLKYCQHQTQALPCCQEGAAEPQGEAPSLQGSHSHAGRAGGRGRSQPSPDSCRLPVPPGEGPHVGQGRGPDTRWEL